MAHAIDVAVGVQHGPDCTCKRLDPITIQPVIVSPECPARTTRATGGLVQPGTAVVVGESGCAYPATFSTFCTCETVTGGIRVDRPDCLMHHPAGPPPRITVNMGAPADLDDFAQQIRGAAGRLSVRGGTTPRTA